MSVKNKKNRDSLGARTSGTTGSANIKTFVKVLCNINYNIKAKKLTNTAHLKLQTLFLYVFTHESDNRDFWKLTVAIYGT